MEVVNYMITNRIILLCVRHCERNRLASLLLKCHNRNFKSVINYSAWESSQPLLSIASSTPGYSNTIVYILEYIAIQSQYYILIYVAICSYLLKFDHYNSKCRLQLATMQTYSQLATQLIMFMRDCLKLHMQYTSYSTQLCLQ